MSNYATLGSYNGYAPGMMGSPPLLATTVTGMYVVPDYSTIGYDSLTHGMGPYPQRYFNIRSAYGAGAGNCNTQYMTRMCNSGGCGGGGGSTGGNRY